MYYYKIYVSSWFINIGIVRPLLYGFGDCENPRQDTIELVEELVIDYITNIVVYSLLPLALLIKL